MKTAVDQLIEKMSLEDVCKYSNELAEAKEMEKEQMGTHRYNQSIENLQKVIEELKKQD
jgi:hypothetical protein